MTELREASLLVKANLALRLILEMAMFAAYAAAPIFALASGTRWILAVIAPLAAISTWGIFATPNDPSRSGKTVVPTPGPVRLLLELGLFSGSVAVLFWADAWEFAAALAAGIIVHYVAWPYRIRWMFKH